MNKHGATVSRHELNPVSFLERSGTVYADRVAVVDGDVSYTWREFPARSRRLASALRDAGLRKGDRIAFLALNSEPLLLAHFGVAQAGGVLLPSTPDCPPTRSPTSSSTPARTSSSTHPSSRSVLDKVPPGVRRLNTHGDFETFLAAGSDRGSNRGCRMIRHSDDQLHVRDNWPAERRDVPLSRRLSQRAGNGDSTTG